MPRLWSGYFYCPPPKLNASDAFLSLNSPSQIGLYRHPVIEFWVSVYVSELGEVAWVRSYVRVILGCQVFSMGRCYRLYRLIYWSRMSSVQCCFTKRCSRPKPIILI